MQAALGQFDLLPLQVAHLGGPQAMAVGHQDHGRVAMAVAAILAGAVHQALDLALGEIASLDCQVYDAWGAFFGCRFHADKLCLRVSYCISYTLSLHSCDALGAGGARLRRHGMAPTRPRPRPGGRGAAERAKISPGPFPECRVFFGSRKGVACFWAT